MTGSINEKIEKAAKNVSLALRPELTVVIPTYNESENILPIVSLLKDALKGIFWEIIFVDDDSPDNTAKVIQKIAREDPRVRLHHRLGKKDLSLACLEGMLSSNSPFVAVMDADMQHDETILPQMLKKLNAGPLDMVIASRFLENGSTGQLPKKRVWISRTASKLSRSLLKVRLTDPMSGFFIMRHSLIAEHYKDLYKHGFKILLDICATLPNDSRYLEIPYTMRRRESGESKLRTNIIIEFSILLVSKTAARYIPVRFALFSMVGLTGVLIHMFTLWLLNQVYYLSFSISLSVAIFLAMTSNYTLNNNFTFRDRKFTGFAFIRGLVSFYIVCSAGAVIGFALGNYLHQLSFSWWVSGLSTTTISAIWNFSVSSIFTWKSKKTSPRFQGKK